MSNRDSMGFGDLLPQDVVEVFAQEKHSKRGRRKRSHSLGRALGWLKGKKNKNRGTKDQNPGLGPALDLALDGHPAGFQGAPKGAPKSGKQGQQQSNSHAVSKRDDDDKTPAPPVLQENVFIEVNRPKYLEDLHTEALEGLKMMQEEERIIGPEYQDNESTISTVSARAEVDGGFTTDSTIPDTSSMVSVQSSVSSRSSRSGLTRQGSTFRPLNSGKKSEKTKTKRRHRKTIGGIPQHVQREFGLDRPGWTVNQQLEVEFLNGETESPSTDVPQLAKHSPQEANNTGVIQPLSSVQEEQHSASHVGHVDDMALLQRLGPAQSGGDRPWSLAVPGMTTTGSQPGPPSPVMSMSPQAAYLSKIIPNAVLPPSIEVVEISRGRSRNSVRTVSKSSLLLSSPASSRASSRASSARTTSSRSSTITSASRHNHLHLSDSSCWSNSDSDTLVSDSSTISSSSTPRQTEAQDRDVCKKQDKVSVHTDASKRSSNSKLIGKGDESKKDEPFVRSLSVMKSKRAPPPPSRSYSLHNKIKRRSRDLADVKIPGQTSEGNMKKIIDSPGYNADTSSLDESPGSITRSPLKSQENVDCTKNAVSKDASNAKKEEHQSNSQSKVISPSSGYSSQDATSPNGSSPKHSTSLKAKLHKLFPAHTNAGPSTSEVTQPEACKNSSTYVSTVSVNPSVKALRELFNIPPHPKVHAPPPPPPEVWSHSLRSIELLLGPPASGNTYAILKKNPKDKRPHRHSPPTSTEVLVKSLVEERKQRSQNVMLASVNVLESQEGSLNVENRTNDCERLVQKKVDVKENGKVQVSEILNSMLVKSVERDRQRLPAITEEHKTSTHTTNNPSISLANISPRQSSKQTVEVTSVVLVQHATSLESSWPPPPPPVQQAGLGSPDETDFPLPPPPVLPEDGLVLPVQVPPDKSSPETSNMSSSLQGIKAPPLNIPPPPSYTAPPPPIIIFASSEKVLPQPKDVSPTPSIISKPPPKAPLLKQISPAATEALSSAPAQSTEYSSPSANKVSAIPPPPKAHPPPQDVSVKVPPPKIIHVLPTKLASLPIKEVPPQPPAEVPRSPELIPPPPTKEVVTATSCIVVSLPAPPPPQVSTLPPKEMFPPPTDVFSEPKEASLPASENNKEVSIPPPIEIPPPLAEVPNPHPGKVSSPTEIEVSSSPKEASPPPPEVSISLPKDLSPPPPLVVITLSPPEISNQSPEEVSLPPQIELPKEPVPSPSVISAVQPKALSSLPSTEVLSSRLEVAPPPPEISNPPPKEVLRSPKEASSFEIVEVVGLQVSEDSPPLAIEEPSFPVIVETSPPLLPEETITAAVKTVLILPIEEAAQSQEDVDQSSEKNKLPLPDAAPSISRPPNDSGPLTLSEEPAAQKEIELSQEDTLYASDSSLPPWKCILAPPCSIPPPPPIEHPTPETLSSQEPNKPQEVPSWPEVSPPTESTTPPQKAEDILAPSPPSVDVHEQEPVSDNVEKQSEEPAPCLVKQEEVSQTLNGSPENPKTQNQPKSEVTVTTQEATNQIQTSPASNEAPQKPIRRSLIISSPPSPPVTVTTQPSILKPPSPNTVTTTSTKSPPAISPSMNLQEAIRLRTAARSHNAPHTTSSRLSIHSPPGFDVRKSPTSTASFIFSKSNKKVVIETRSEAKADVKTETSVTKASEEHMVKKEFKVPPPVARKPKTKAKETESGDTEQTAGQDASASIKDNTKKPNGTAGTVEGH